MAHALGGVTPESLSPDDQEGLPLPGCRHVCPIPVAHEAVLVLSAHQGEDNELSLTPLRGVHSEDADIGPIVLVGLPGEQLDLGGVTGQHRNILVRESGRLDCKDQIGNDRSLPAIVAGRAIDLVRPLNIDQVPYRRDHVALLAD